MSGAAACLQNRGRSPEEGSTMGFYMAAVAETREEQRANSVFAVIWLLSLPGFRQRGHSLAPALVDWAHFGWLVLMSWWGRAFCQGSVTTFQKHFGHQSFVWFDQQAWKL